MDELNRKELSVYRELAEHVGGVLAKRWLGSRMKAETVETQMGSESETQTATGNKSGKPRRANGARK